jgi:hypothetical protein
MTLTNKHLKDLLPSVLSEIEGKRNANRNERPDLILEGWAQIVDEKWRSMTQASSFEKGQLVVKVKNAALYSVLVQQEREKLLKKLQKKFPEAEIKNIIFRIG